MKPLDGKTLVVTRSADDFDSAAAKIAALGGTAVSCPMISFVLPDDTGPLDDCIRRLATFDWILFTSANAVYFFFQRLDIITQSQIPDDVQIGAIGPATKRALQARSIEPAIVARQSSAEGFFLEFEARYAIQDRHFLIPSSSIARKTLPELLQERGGDVFDVVAYDNRPADSIPQNVLEILKHQSNVWVLFTSSSTVNNFIDILERKSVRTDTILAGSIGPSTSATLRERGLEPAAEADPHTFDGLLDAVSNEESSERK